MDSLQDKKVSLMR